MPDDLQSIEDLISTASDDDSIRDDSTQAKFSQKEKEIKLKDLERITEQKAASLGLPYMNLVGFPISPDALGLIKEVDAQELKTISFFYDGKNIRLGTINPDNSELEKKASELNEKYHSDVAIYLISSHSLDHAFKLYHTIPKVRETIKGVKIEEEDLDKYSEKIASFKDIQAQINKAKMTDVITIIMASSIKAGSSDIHIEAEEKGIKVRFRIDGVLYDVAILSKEMYRKIISRLKVLAGVKINVSDKPQDGRMSIHTKKERIDIRASFLPTNYGESVAMRILRSSAVGLEFDELGISGRAFEQIKKEVERPNGMIITTGPTGSGKTTTLYAILKKLNDPETKIITIEDPIEYQLEGINQSQVGKKYTFAKALRSIVRQDPDIIMVGEIRDLETAEIGIQAALTGHLVLSTIHTNDAAGAIPRFLSMGVKPFLLAPAINTVIGQRLVRRICKKCKTNASLDDNLMAEVREIIKTIPEESKRDIDINNLKFYQGQGCEACQGLKYKGRIGIYEILIMNEEIEKLILSDKVSEYDIREIAIKNGMITMVQDGLLKALAGITSVNEVLRVAEQK